MKSWYRVFWMVYFLGVLMTVVFLWILPETIPVHYNAFFQVDRYGSKLEGLLFLPIATVQGAIFYLISKKQEKKKKSGATALLLVAIFSLIFYFGMAFLFFYTAWKH